MKETVLQPSHRFLSHKRIIFSWYFHGIAFTTHNYAATDYNETFSTAIIFGVNRIVLIWFS